MTHKTITSLYRDKVNFYFVIGQRYHYTVIKQSVISKKIMKNHRLNYYTGIIIITFKKRTLISLCKLIGFINDFK